MRKHLRKYLQSKRPERSKAMADTIIMSRVNSLIETTNDDVVREVVNLVEDQLRFRLGGVEDVPEDLYYIVINVSVARYNQIGDEGKSSMTVEGESATWLADLFAPYEKDIQAYLDNRDKASNGVRVRFL